MKNIVKTKGLTKSYKGACVVNDVDMNVREGRIYGFLGPNGAGKTTTLKMLLSLVRPTAGEIEIMGQPLSAGTRIHILRNIGSLIESPSYYGHLTGEENLRILAAVLDVPKSNIEKVLQIVRLDKQQGKKTSAYSLGMKQRLGLAGALLAFPKLLILDEPTNGLDPSGIQEMRELIKSFPGQYGMTVIVSSHLLSEIDRMAEDVGVIANGKMMYQGSLEGLHSLDRTKSLEEIFIDLTGRDQSL